MVTVRVPGDFFQCVTGALGGNLSEFPLHSQNQISINPHFGGRSLDATKRLVHEDAGVRSRETLAFRPGRQQELPHRGRHSHRHGHHVGFHILHGVIDSHTRGDGAAGRIDVEINVGIRVLGRQQQHLGANRIGIFLADFIAQPNDALFQQALVNKPTRGYIGRFFVAINYGHVSSSLGSLNPNGKPRVIRAAFPRFRYGLIPILTARVPWRCRSVSFRFIHKSLPGGFPSSHQCGGVS